VTGRHVRPDTVPSPCHAGPRLRGDQASCSGTPGKRITLPNARVLIHQPLGGAQGQSSDLEIQIREVVELRERMIGILSDATGRDRATIASDIDRDRILRGQAAVDYGLVDHVIAQRLARPTAAAA
jgi:ATP-dependent Clp protease protease subunit